MKRRFLTPVSYCTSVSRVQLRQDSIFNNRICLWLSILLVFLFDFVCKNIKRKNIWKHCTHVSVYAVIVDHINVNKNKPPVVKCVKLDEKTKRFKEGMEYMYKLHRETSLDSYKEDYKKYKYEYCKEVRRRKVEHISKQIRNSDCVSKSCWAVVNDMRNTDSKTKINNIELSIHNDNFSDPYIVSNIFNDYNPDVCVDGYAYIFNDYFIDAIENDTCMKQERKFKYDKEKEWDSCKLPTVTIRDITQLIDSLKNKRSAGWDEFSPFLLKKCKVKPLFKKGERKQPQNYRPIALTSVFGKLIEKIMREILMEHYNMNNLIGDFQHGFRSCRSTISAAVQFVHCLMEKINEESYLKDRQQCTEVVYDNGEVIEKRRSKIRNINFCVSQGSILGPFLFICYVNDFPKVLDTSHRITMYADDTSGVFWARSNDDLNSVVQNFVEKAQTHFEKENLRVNINKSNLIYFKTSGSNTKTVVNEDIKENTCSECKFLGIYIDDRLSWNQQIDHVCGKITSSLYLLRRLVQYLDIEALKIAYFGLVYLHLSYGIVLWGGYSQYNIKRVFVLQKRVIRTMAKVRPRTSCKNLFIKFNIMTIYAVYMFQSILLVKKDKRVTNRNMEIHDYNTR
ncbi:uncharacterized protein LOC124623080 [Schistocerca americana]|uniref:uncharacterized protein LOC124623080 n=1 Tax=Schistocerca americana TaxID=7009 RepID=UPI001F500C2B|nr:uncharacterized protein LOC124623080 [Schistocerca americana]